MYITQVMDWSKLASNLKIDIWYKAIVYIGTFGILASIFVPVQAYNNENIMILMFGLFFIGCGEWKNHKPFANIQKPSLSRDAIMVKGIKRDSDIIGNAFLLVGGLLIILFILKILNYA
jgi:hypothetical protein